MANTIQTLYDTLFAELADLRAGKVDVNHAKATADVSNALTRAIECELKYIDKIGAPGTGIIREAHLTPGAPALEGPVNGLPHSAQRRIIGAVQPVNSWPRVSKDGTNE